MRVLILVLATLALVLSAGLILVFYVVPGTSFLEEGRPEVALSVWYLFALLLSGVVAGFTILLTAFSRASSVLRSVASTGVLLSGLIALADVGFAAFFDEIHIAHIWWADLLLLTLAVSFYFGRRELQQPWSEHKTTTP